MAWLADDLVTTVRRRCRIPDGGAVMSDEHRRDAAALDLVEVIVQRRRAELTLLEQAMAADQRRRGGDHRLGAEAGQRAEAVARLDGAARLAYPLVCLVTIAFYVARYGICSAGRNGRRSGQPCRGAAPERHEAGAPHH